MDALTATESQTPPSTSSSYIEPFAQIAALQAKGDHYGLIQAAERVDLTATNDNHPTRLLITIPLVLSCMIVNDLPSAKFALTRLPDAVASLPLARAMLNLFASVWERRYEHVYSRGEALLGLVRQGDFPHAEMSGVLATLVTACIESFRHRTIVLLSNAYTAIPLALAQIYLGLPADELLSIALLKGWNFDPTTHILTPARAVRKTGLSATTPSTFAMFDAVTDNVARLEV